jgi:outer membrane protein W
MKKTHLLGLIAGLIALPAVAGAEDTYLSLKGGVFLPNGKSGNGLNSFDAGYSVDFSLGYRLEQYVAVELGTGVYTAKGSTATATTSDSMELFAVPVTVTVKGLLSLERTELYAGAGGGYYFGAMDRKQTRGAASADETSHGGALGYHVVAGADYRLNKNVSLGAEFKWFATKPELEFTDLENGGKTKNKWELGGSTFGLAAKYWF